MDEINALMEYTIFKDNTIEKRFVSTTIEGRVNHIRTITISKKEIELLIAKERLIEMIKKIKKDHTI
jgi:hypothetical protein